MPALKTPKYVDHPADSLSKLVPDDVKNQLLRTPKLLLIENPVYTETLKTLRNSFQYSYIVQWIYLLKHVIKLSDAFDVENFEEELLNIAPPVFLNSLKSKLILHLKNQKLQNIEVEFDFFVDQIYKDYNLIEGDLDDDTHEIVYSKLPLLDQIDVLYNLVKLSNTKNYLNLRKNVDKFEKPQIELKIHPVYEIIDKNRKTEYLILQDARVYLREFEYKSISIPTRKSEYDEKLKHPYDDLRDLDPKMTKWECLTSGIYQYDNLIKDLKKSYGKKTSSDEFKLSKILEANIDFVITHDLKKRKQSAQRKREIEMQLLMANRKRSSRLEEKEKRKREEEEERMKELELIKLHAAQLRAEKRQKLKASIYSSKPGMAPDTSITREERLRKRHEQSTDSVETPEVVESGPNQTPPESNTAPETTSAAEIAPAAEIKSTTETNPATENNPAPEITPAPAAPPATEIISTAGTNPDSETSISAIGVSTAGAASEDTETVREVPGDILKQNVSN